MNVRQLIAELHLQPAEALVVTPAEPFGFSDSVSATLVRVKVLHSPLVGVTHCEADNSRGTGKDIQAVCLGPAGDLGCV